MLSGIGDEDDLITFFLFSRPINFKLLFSMIIFINNDKYTYNHI